MLRKFVSFSGLLFGVTSSTYEVLFLNQYLQLMRVRSYRLPAFALMNHSQTIAIFYLVVGALLIASGVLGMSRIPDMVMRKIEGESTLEELDSIGA